jgi:hypothetical protein
VELRQHAANDGRLAVGDDALDPAGGHLALNGLLSDAP